MTEWILRLFSNHQNPIIKLNSTNKKYFIPENSEEQRVGVELNLAELHRILNSERVDRRCARSKGEWLEKEHLVIIEKFVGSNLGHLGFGYNKKKCIHPIEALYLLETNRLEILFKSIPLSVQQCYNVFLNNSLTELNKYRMYRKLSIDGYKLKNNADWKNKFSTLEPNPKKVKLDLETTGECSKTADRLSEIFLKLQQNGPQSYEGKLSLDCDYNLYSPDNIKKEKPDIDLFLHDGTEFNPKYGLLEENSCNVISIVTPNNVAFYRFSKINLPSFV